MPPDSGGILRGGPLLGGAICPNVVSRVEQEAEMVRISFWRVLVMNTQLVHLFDQFARGDAVQSLI